MRFFDEVTFHVEPFPTPRPEDMQSLRDQEIIQRWRRRVAARHYRIIRDRIKRELGISVASCQALHPLPKIPF